MSGAAGAACPSRQWDRCRRRARLRRTCRDRQAQSASRREHPREKPPTRNSPGIDLVGLRDVGERSERERIRRSRTCSSLPERSALMKMMPNLSRTGSTWGLPRSVPAEQRREDRTHRPVHGLARRWRNSRSDIEHLLPHSSIEHIDPAPNRLRCNGAELLQRLHSTLRSKDKPQGHLVLAATRRLQRARAHEQGQHGPQGTAARKLWTGCAETPAAADRSAVFKDQPVTSIPRPLDAPNGRGPDHCRSVDAKHSVSAEPRLEIAEPGPDEVGFRRGPDVDIIALRGDRQDVAGHRHAPGPCATRATACPGPAASVRARHRGASPPAPPALRCAPSEPRAARSRRNLIDCLPKPRDFDWFQQIMRRRHVECLERKTAEGGDEYHRRRQRQQPSRAASEIPLEPGISISRRTRSGRIAGDLDQSLFGVARSAGDRHPFALAKQVLEPPDGDRLVVDNENPKLMHKSPPV